MVNEFLIRLGNFFILIGVALMIYFGITYFSNAPEFQYFFLGLIGILIGRWFTRRKTPPPPSGRFTTIRRMLGSSRDKPGPKQEPKKE